MVSAIARLEPAKVPPSQCIGVCPVFGHGSRTEAVRGAPRWCCAPDRIHNNPVRAGVAAHAGDSSWTSHDVRDGYSIRTWACSGRGSVHALLRRWNPCGRPDQEIAERRGPGLQDRRRRGVARWPAARGDRGQQAGLRHVLGRSELHDPEATVGGRSRGDAASPGHPGGPRGADPRRRAGGEAAPRATVDGAVADGDRAVARRGSGVLRSRTAVARSDPGVASSRAHDHRRAVPCGGHETRSTASTINR